MKLVRSFTRIALVLFACNSLLTQSQAEASASLITPIKNATASCSIGRLTYVFSQPDHRVWQTNPGSTEGLELLVNSFETVETAEQGSATQVDAILPMLFQAYGEAQFLLYSLQQDLLLDLDIRFVDPNLPLEKKRLTRKQVPCQRVVMN
jgi:hypothetical protein